MTKGKAKGIGFRKEAPKSVKIGDEELHIASNDLEVLARQFAAVLADQSGSGSLEAEFTNTQLTNAIDDIDSGRGLSVAPERSQIIVPEEQRQLRKIGFLPVDTQ